MDLEFALWQWLALAGLAFWALLYAFTFRIWAAFSAGLDWLFVGALAIAVCGVAAPGLFEAGARSWIERSRLPDALQAADAQVAALETLPRRLIDRALAKLGIEPEQAADPAEVRESHGSETMRARDPDAATDASTGARGIEAAPPRGPFESRVRPAVEGLLAGFLRVAALLGSGWAMLLTLSVRGAAGRTRELDKMRRRVEALEARLADGALSRVPAVPAAST